MLDKNIKKVPMRTALTKNTLMKTIPCSDYTPGFIDNLFGNLEYAELDDILNAPVDTTDKIWVLLREPWLNERQLLELASIFYKDVAWLDTEKAQYYKDMTLQASKGKLTEEHFYRLDSDYLAQWQEVTSKESQAVIQTGIWAALTVNAQCKEQKMSDEKRKGILESHRMEQLAYIVETIMWNQANEKEGD